MDVKEQTQRTLERVNALAIRAIELPPDAREALMTGRPAPGDPRGLSSGQTSGSSAVARPDLPTGLGGRPVAA